MSFILDALKKSESERQRKNPPGIASIPESDHRRSSSRWIWLVLALVTVNLVVLAGLMLKVDQESGSADLPDATTIQETIPIPTASRSEIEAELTPSEPAITKVEPQAATGEQPADRPPATASISAAQSGTVFSGLESFNDLRAKGVLALPDMHLDIHVYSAQAEDRFVFVNMSKYKENATLSEGPLVSEITPDGVILNYQGTDFLLPRE